MPYLTPDSLPEGSLCRPLLIPDDTVWLAIVSGALTELVKPYNWQLFGTLTVDECVEAMQLMIDAYYDGLCNDCELPTGTPPFRIGPDGNIEQLIDGEWVTPAGDYTLPPTPEREESTCDERRCAAAANAANVLKILYEDLADSFAEALSTVDAAVKLGVAIGGGIGLLFGLISTSLLSAAGAAFAGVYAGVEFITADVWTTEFDDLVKCMLYDCSSCDGDVVTFDYACFFQNLWDATNLFDVTFSEQRLFYQISVILTFLGVEALDAAGATTAIETSDCEDCVDHWCFRMEFTEDDYGFASACYNFPSATCSVTWDSGGWHSNLGSTANGITRFAIIELNFDEAEIIEIGMEMHVEGETSDDVMGCAIRINSIFNSASASVEVPSANNVDFGCVAEFDPPELVDYVAITGYSSPDSGTHNGTGNAYITTLVFKGRGPIPTGWENNCEF